MMIDRSCIGCGKAFAAKVQDVRRGRGKYCSLDCSVRNFVKSNVKHRQLVAGDKLHMLTLVSLVARGRNPTWLVKCDCGTEKVTRASRLQGGILSCGCYRRPRTHEKSVRPEYKVWRGMMDRTNNVEDHLYGGRGISVCERWQTFQNFVDDMGKRPSAKHSIDRVDNDGNYEPGNCRWATPKEQARNRRQNIFVDVDGKKLCLLDAVRILNPSLDYETVTGRLANGWPFDKAISLPRMPGVALRNR